MKRIVVGLALLCAPMVGQAQVSYSFTNFATFTGGALSGFTTDLLLRNTNQYSDPITYGVGTVVLFKVSDRVKTFCLGFAQHCEITVGSTFSSGAVQRSNYVRGGHTVYVMPYFTDGCNADYCFSAYGQQDRSQGVLGCKVPLSGLDTYIGRTCDADGLTGSVGLRARFSVYSRDGNTFNFAPSDMDASFTNKILATTTIPEPATWALMLSGLAALALAKRRTRA